MDLSKSRAKRGRWRLFRHEAGRDAGPAPWVYVVLFLASQALGHWSVAHFGSVTVWLSNGVMAAALLQLKRRSAVAVVVACFAINLASNAVRGDPGIFLWVNALLNLFEAVTVSILARRVCGAALDMRRPRRLANFALLACVPAVAVSALIAVGLMALTMPVRVPLWLFYLHTYFDVELLGMLLTTPILLMLARRHRFVGMARASTAEGAALTALSAAMTAFVFFQTTAPIAFAAFIPLILIAFRLSPPSVAAALVITALISGVGTLTGHGPVHLTRIDADPDLAAMPEMVRRLAIYNLFLLGMVVTILPISTVMTERRRMEQRLQHRTEIAQAARRRAEEAAAAKSRFLALMSHEMRTPLTGVAGYADLLSRRPGLDKETRRQVEGVRRSGDAMLRLVEDILDVSRGGDEVLLEPVRLDELVDEASVLCRGDALDKGLLFEVTASPAARATPVMTDRLRLRQALRRLVANAVKFTRSGGVRVAADYADGRVILSVRDTGCGVDPVLRPSLFEVFHQGDDSIARSHEGAGLGLALAHAAVARLGGGIRFESPPEGGSLFVLEAPAERVQAAPAADSPAGDLRALIVDDHPVNRDLLRLMLEAAGCSTEEACDGREAVAAATRGAFDLILMDVRMPGMDGLTATRAIRQLPAPICDVPILAVTADAMPEDAARCLAAGMDAHLAKPVTQARLYEAVNLTLETAAARAPVAA